MWYYSTLETVNPISNEIGIDNRYHPSLSYDELEKIVRGKQFIFHSDPNSYVDGSSYRLIVEMTMYQRSGSYPSLNTLYKKRTLAFKTPFESLSINPDLVSILSDTNKNGIQDAYEDYQPSPDTTWYKDSDRDGYSSGDTKLSVDSPGSEYYQASSLTATSGDCNDNEIDVYPGAPELCDGIDNQCPGDSGYGTIDENCDGGDGEDSICGAYVAPGVWKEFDCYNLAAIGKTTGDDPFTPSWRLIGGYWQWGRKGPDSSQWYDTNTANFAHGPTGPDVADANDGAISGWDSSYAPDGAWSDSYKTANDPCPSGYRVPTNTQWGGVDQNNIQSTVGTWSKSATNYSSGRFFGDDLMLPAAGAGWMFNFIRSLSDRGSSGYYWSSTEGSGNYAYTLHFYSSHAGRGASLSRSYGISVRCVAE